MGGREPIFGAIPMTEREYQRIVNKQYRLPEQIERARKRLRHLEGEAKRYGLHDLVERSQ